LAQAPIDVSPMEPSVGEQPGVGVLRIELDGLRDVHQGLVPQLLIPVGPTAPVPRLPTIRLQLDGSGVLDDGLLPLPTTTVKLPELVPIFSHVGVCGCQLLKEMNGLPIDLLRLLGPTGSRQ